MSNKQRISVVLMLMVVGTMTLVQALHRPQMANVRTVDMVSLTGVGFAYGTAWGLLIAWIRAGRQRREGSERVELLTQ